MPDFDAALLLLAMCDSYSPATTSPYPVDWHTLIVDDIVGSALSISGLGTTPWATVAPYLDVSRPQNAAGSRTSCRRTAGWQGLAVAKDGEGRGGASHAAVQALPTEAGDGTPCAICRDEMAPGLGGSVCGLRPCGHRFHWPCALRWLARRNPCPCCRTELPAEDTLVETRRLWRAVERMAGAGDSGGCA